MEVGKLSHALFLLVEIAVGWFLSIRGNAHQRVFEKANARGFLRVLLPWEPSKNGRGKAGIEGQNGKMREAVKEKKLV